jgi:Tol biopolymer transport system component
MRRLLGLLACLALLSAACSARTPNSGPTQLPSLSPSPTPSGTVTPKPRVPSARFALYALDDKIWLYDVAKDANTELAHGEGVRQPKFVDDHEISFIQGSTTGVIRILDLKTRAVRDVITEQDGINVYGWSPDRQTLAYITTDPQAYPHLVFWHAGADAPTQTVATLARAFGRGAVTSDQAKIEFSSDGQEVLVVYTPADGTPQDSLSPDQSQLQVRTINGELSFAADMRDEPTMGLWSADGARVYYRTDRGARVWHADTGSIGSVSGAGTWYDPMLSPDGKLIAYDTGEQSARVRVRVFDAKNATTTFASAPARFSPVFATARLLWAQAVAACKTCQGFSTELRTVYAIDVKNGQERKLALPVTTGIDVLYR